ncbi:phospholipase D family protein [Microcoleus sp. S36b_A3]|uniref:phospholipase D family protein n=1 Tax=unclassified Microcoleus TaxID=2642155 RepID=UPI002FCF22C7
MSVIRFVILEDCKKSLETTIDDFLLKDKEYYWDKIYLFSAFVNDYGVKQIEKILVHPSLNENTEVLIAIGQKDNFNDPSDIQKLLKFIDEESTKIKTTKPVRFICPTNNFHIKTYCFLGRRVKDDKEIGFSIIGSSNLTGLGLKCEGELCISIHHLNLTKELIYRLTKKYSNSPQWKQEIENYLSVQQKSTPVNQDQAPITSTPQKGKFLKLGVTDDSALIDKGTNLVKGTEDIDWFYFAHTTIEQTKEDFPEGSLCLLLTENKIFQIAKIRSYSSDQEKTEGCFVIYTKKVTHELSGDIREILEKEEYEKIKIAEKEYEEYIKERNEYPDLEYATLKDFENEVKEYQEYQKMLDDPKYQKWIEKGKKKTQLEILDRILQIGDPILMKQELELLRQSL